MQRQSICHLIIALFAIGLIACGDSDDDKDIQQDVPAKSTTQTPIDSEDIAVREEVDFNVEEGAIRDLFTSHAAAVTERKVNKIMDHWLKLETRDVFMAWNFWNAFTRIETWKGVKGSFAGTFEKFNNAMNVTITEVGIDKRGKEATLQADYQWLQNGKLIAAFKKDNKEQWKIQAIDFSNKDLIKWIKTPEPQ
ncbi:hypothetical protein IH992_16700 [Candidatus Poribacteria bacterium]|nr:hypothetical protein [Candidatus Poribacteria bacterium]